MMEDSIFWRSLLNVYRLNLKLVEKETGFTYTKPIPKKSARTIFSIFKQYVIQMERQTGKYIKIVRTDVDGAFDREFLEYCREIGVVKYKGAPYDHHFAERTNGITSN